MKNLKPCQNDKCINYHPEYTSRCVDMMGEISIEWISKRCKLYQPEKEYKEK